MNMNLGSVFENPVIAAAGCAAAGYYLGKKNTTWAVVGGVLGLAIAKAYQTRLALTPAAQSMLSSSHSGVGGVSAPVGALTYGGMSASATAPAGATAVNPAELGAAASFGQPVAGFGEYEAARSRRAYMSNPFDPSAYDPAGRSAGESDSFNPFDLS